MIGMFVSTYHYLIEWGILEHPAVCAAGVPCNLVYVRYFGFVTIPFMALTAFVMITIIMIVTKWSFTRTDTLAIEN
jgi:disulfide bond formation protein DsbB